MPGCVVGVVSHGELIFAKGYGSANLDYGIPLMPDSRIMIASISKQFTAAALLMLEQEGKLDMDEDIRTYIPEMPDLGYPITSRQIMYHTSGLRDIYSLLDLADIGLDNTTTTQQALALLSRQQGLNFRPGAEHLYSNSGYFLISVLVKNITGKSLREYTDEHFFKPIGMNSTHFHDDTRLIVPDRVISYRPTVNGPGRFYRDNMDRIGARGLITTIEDMALWDRNFIENKSNLQNFTERMTETGFVLDGRPLNYAAGLRVNQYRSIKTIGHGGNYMGFRSKYMQFPEQQLSVITFCNMSNINPTTLTHRVADLYLKEVFVNKLMNYTGHYRNESFDTSYDILMDDGKLCLTRGSKDKDHLEWRKDDQFRAGLYNINFNRDNQGKIDQIGIRTSSTGNITFKKSKVP